MKPVPPGTNLAGTAREPTDDRGLRQPVGAQILHQGEPEALR